MDSALSIAEDFHRDYLEQKQGEEHLTPKTLALIDTNLFRVFLETWEAFSAELVRLLNGGDPFVLSYLSRARQIAIAFVGYTDEGQQKTAVDIGSFLATFDAACQPDEASDLYRLRTAAVDAYYDMQVASGVGEGTLEATGVQIFWPTRLDYVVYESFYDQVLFEELDFATADAPNWLEFLTTYYNYNAATVSASSTSSICRGDPTSVTQPTREGQLLLNPTSEEIDDGFLVETEVVLNVDEVIVEYGLDLTPALATRQENRKLTRNGPSRTRVVPRHPLLASSHRYQRQRRINSLQRRAQEDYLYLYGGDVEGSYDGSKYEATWDGHFFVFVDGKGNWEPAFGLDLGSNSRALPVMYFPPNITVTGADFPLRTTEEEAKELGGIYGFLSILTPSSEGLITAVTLYTDSLDTFSETPRAAGGQIVPIIYGEAYIDGESYFEYVGGFNGTVFDWGEDSDLAVETQHWRTVLEDNSATLGLETIVLSVAAYDLDVFDGESESIDGTDLVFFEFSAACAPQLAIYVSLVIGTTFLMS